MEKMKNRNLLGENSQIRAELDKSKVQLLDRTRRANVPASPKENELTKFKDQIKDLWARYEQEKSGFTMEKEALLQERSSLLFKSHQERKQKENLTAQVGDLQKKLADAENYKKEAVIDWNQIPQHILRAASKGFSDNFDHKILCITCRSRYMQARARSIADHIGRSHGDTSEMSSERPARTLRVPLKRSTRTVNTPARDKVRQPPPVREATPERQARDPATQRPARPTQLRRGSQDSEKMAALKRVNLRARVAKLNTKSTKASQPWALRRHSSPSRTSPKPFSRFYEDKRPSLYSNQTRSRASPSMSPRRV